MLEESSQTTWRELLKDMIADGRERDRIASEVNVNSATLTRWAHNETNPRPQILRQLLKALPKHRGVLLPLIRAEFPTFAANYPFPGETRREAIPGQFYTLVMRTRAVTHRAIRYLTLGNLILEQALKHLDPDQVGIGINIARCLPPARGDTISSLLADLGRGSSPWTQTMENESMLLGAESLAGYAAVYAHPVALSDLSADTMLPASVGMWERSAVAAPIMFESRVAGSLLVSCTEAGYFAAEHVQLVSDYANLVALVFEPDQFFEPHRLQLQVFPSQTEQQPFIHRFRERVSEIMRTRQPISISQAEQLAWQQIEEELRQLQLLKGV